MTIIQSVELYPRNGIVHLANGDGRPHFKVGPAWPDLSPGQIVEVHDQQGWHWRVEIVEVHGGERASARPLEERKALPMPPGTPMPDGKLKLLTPAVSGHAHLRNWRTGDIVEHDGGHWKVKDVTKKYSHHQSWVLTPASEKDWATRPGRVVLQGNPEEAIGSAIQKGSEWVHVKEVKRQSHRDFESGESYGSTWWGFGNFCSEEKAAKINSMHPATLSKTLRDLPSKRVVDRLPEGSPYLIKPHAYRSLVPSGERVAVVDGRVLHERCGDPDMQDTVHRYTVEVECPPEVKKRVISFVKKAG